MASAPSVSAGAPTLTETAIVLTARLGLAGRALLARFMEEVGVSAIAFDEVHWRTAADAFLRFGKGRHPAALNFGDCMTYATARQAGRPLLHTGSDFNQTDLQVVGPN
jgi:ribonuclease VapC